MTVIEIPCSGVEFGLVDLLLLASADVSKMAWKIINFEGVSMPNTTFPHAEIDAAIAARGYWSVSWAELVVISQAIFQTIWCSIHGTNPSSGEQLVIEAFDGSAWLIATTDPAFIAAIVRRFPLAKESTIDHMEYPPQLSVDQIEKDPDRG
jgi:hypothetical protein